jgi:hypothetical protein
MKDEAFNAGFYLFADAFNKGRTPKRLKPTDYYVDKAIDLMYDIFPHPYHV